MTWPLSLLKQSKSRCWLTGKLSRAIGPHLNGDRLSSITHSPASLKIPSRGGHSLQKSTEELDPSPTCVPKSRLLSLLERHLSKAPIEKTWATASVKAVYWDVQNTWARTTSEGLYWVSDRGRHQGIWKGEWQQEVTWGRPPEMVWQGSGCLYWSRTKIQGREGTVPSDKCVQAWTGGLAGFCFRLSFQWYFLLSPEPIA